MRYYLIAGEKSGDLHGAALMQALRCQDREAIFRCWGGDSMLQAGATIVQHYKEIAVMGLNALRKAVSIFRLLHLCKRDIVAYQPDVLILIDYAGFNLKIAQFAKKKGITVYYYISPKIWAWGSKRIYKIKHYVDKMFAIFPFEKSFYNKYNYHVDYVGNPLVQAVKKYIAHPHFISAYKLNAQPIIALLPGSRLQEVQDILPVMLSIIPFFNGYQFLIAAVSSLPSSLYQSVKHIDNVHIIYDQSYDILTYAYAAIVASGTATLETALFHVPQVIVYKTNFFTYLAGKLLLQIRYIGLTNILADCVVAQELIQYTYTTHRLRKALEKILQDEYRRKQLYMYQVIKKILGDEDASQRTASLIIYYLTAQKKTTI